MFGEGDLVRHLSQLTYRLQYHQDPLAEFDLSLISMSSDIKDGLRLCKLAEALTGRKSCNHAKAVTSLISYFRGCLFEVCSCCSDCRLTLSRQQTDKSGSHIGV